VKNSAKIEGVIAPLVTPFNNDEVDYNGLLYNINMYNETDLDGYFVLGTNGEFKALSLEERYKVLEIVIANSAAEKKVIACTHSESTKHTIEITKKAADIGVDLVSILMPNFFAKLIDSAVMKSYIIDVAEESPVPVMLYNNPSVSNGVLITKEVIREVSGHKNVVGMKNSSKVDTKEYIEASANSFQLLSGSANFFYRDLKAGAVGGVMSLANVIPDKCVKLYKLFQNDNLQEARKLNKKIVDLNRNVSGFKGISAVKKAMDILDYKGGKPRKPLKGLTEEETEKLSHNLSSIK